MGQLGVAPPNTAQPQQPSQQPEQLGVAPPNTAQPAQPFQLNAPASSDAAELQHRAQASLASPATASIAPVPLTSTPEFASAAPSIASAPVPNIRTNMCT